LVLGSRRVFLRQSSDDELNNEKPLNNRNADVSPRKPRGCFLPSPAEPDLDSPHFTFTSANSSTEHFAFEFLL
jgi:hypothetical protein